MNPRFNGKPDIFTLDDIPRGFLQVLLPEFALTKEGQGRLLEISIRDDLHAIRDSAGKKQFFEILDAAPGGRKQLQEELKQFQNDPRILSYRFDCSSSPLRYGNGGVLPVIRWRHERGRVDEYFCLFYRDIFPIGWNIANGASDNVEEMLDPERILLREFGEELLIRDDQSHIVYTFDPGRDKDPSDSPSKARKAWEREHPTMISYKTLSVPMTWISGHDRVRVVTMDDSRVSRNYFLNIVPDDNAIEVDRVALINVKGKVSFFDGEQSRGVVLNRAVGLFNVKRFQTDRYLMGHDFIPDKVFFEGKPGNPTDLENVIRQQIDKLMRLKSPFRTKEDRKKWLQSAKKWDLCPISRIMIKRYLETISNQPREQAFEDTKEKKQQQARCDVFISYRSSDQPIAQWLHDYLKNSGLRLFFSAESLPLLGESDYAAAIDLALESAKCMVVLGTSPECFDSGWVGYEWRSFLNEKLSGRKRDSQLFTFVSGVEVQQLPFALRNVQMIPFSATSPQDSFENLLRFLRQALGKKK
jgi:hypothetical protein